MNLMVKEPFTFPPILNLNNLYLHQTLPMNPIFWRIFLHRSEEETHIHCIVSVNNNENILMKIFKFSKFLLYYFNTIDSYLKKSLVASEGSDIGIFF